MWFETGVFLLLFNTFNFTNLNAGYRESVNLSEKARSKYCLVNTEKLIGEKKTYSEAQRL